MSTERQFGDASGFDDITRLFEQMLEDGRHIFDAAANALLGGTDPEAIREDLFRTDRLINESEQQLRRMIVVHGTVRGTQSFPSLLVMMSLAKDAERIGDYAKNIFDLAVLGPDFGSEENRQLLIKLKDEISTCLARARDVHAAEDADGARALMAECDRIQDVCDGNMEAALKGEAQGTVAFALASRYFKRVAGHAANVATSLVMPLHKLDFFDES